MCRYFGDRACPTTSEALASLIEAAFEELTGFMISEPEPFYVEKYSHGGMSSGYVNPKWWRETAVSLLQSRLPARRHGLPDESK
jgi:hypothetical protein